jgi:hypothetical protein
MNKKEIEELIRQADERRALHQHAAAAEFLERAATETREPKLWRAAADIWAKDGTPAEAERCYVQASVLLHGEEKADCLFACWRTYASAIASEEWECNFEYRGAGEDHDSDHQGHHDLIDEYAKAAGRMLELIFAISGVPREQILSWVEAEIARLKEGGGWGADCCRAILSKVACGQTD